MMFVYVCVDVGNLDHEARMQGIKCICDVDAKNRRVGGARADASTSWAK